MRYFSTNRQSPDASFREAVVQGQPPDRGLYFVSEVPQIDPSLTRDLDKLSTAEIALRVIRPYVGGEVPEDELFRICAECVDFEFPLVEVTEGVFALELFHGPTLAFKDVGARFMSRCLSYFSEPDRKTLVIAATSGDTGGAVAAGFHNVDNVEVVILYPSGKVSRVQELQLTTMGGNVTALEVEGSFDDCQELAKTALADSDLRSRARLTSANSINIARWLPQQFYYFFAMRGWSGDAPVFSVPSGNFGNLASGLLAYRSGLPVGHFIAACNANDVFPRFLSSGTYEPRESIQTLSNAMDVGSPSNFVRVIELFGGDIHALRRMVTAVRIGDDETSATIREVYDATGYVLDPHGAVGYRALVDSRRRGIFLETAHPVKFDSVSEILGTEPTRPAAVMALESREKVSIRITPDPDKVKELLVSIL